MHSTILQITNEIRKRSTKTRAEYLAKIEAEAANPEDRSNMGCSNLAHGVASCDAIDKQLIQGKSPNIGIVSAYNDMLSAHQPYEEYPKLIKAAAKNFGASAQVAGCVPAMCDGVTQGRPGMDLSLFSRDVIALSTAVSLSHNMYDAVICLGICDKIVPGLLIGALSFGHLPTIFIPAGPMQSGVSNKEKAQVREDYANKKVGREQLIAVEMASYHSPGTCTFYGTANSNQMLMEFMGLQLPGGSFVNPGTPLRDALTTEAVSQVLKNTRDGGQYVALANVISVEAIVNGMIGLLASGGSTNHTIHLVAIAKAAGIEINWSDFAKLSAIVPLLARVYPNGPADINHFHSAGGTGFLIAELLGAGLLHQNVETILGKGLDRFIIAPSLDDAELKWAAHDGLSNDKSILRTVTEPFQAEGGLCMVEGNLGRAIVKISAVDEAHQKVTAPARVFNSQAAVLEAFDKGMLEFDVVVVLTHQGPRANGMPELHKLTPMLGVLQNRGFKVALLTDGRMSGASGKILAAIQLSPEAIVGGAISKIVDGDVISIDASNGIMNVDADLDSRTENKLATPDQANKGMGRELFGAFRSTVSSAESGATIF